MQKFMGVALLAATITTGCGSQVAGVRVTAAAKPVVATAKAPVAKREAASSNPDAMEARNVQATERSLTIEAGGGAQRVLAAAGGVFTSADGSASVSVPPGVLDRDAVIRVLPVDTHAKALTADFVPGIAFRLDLGGASILPGKSVMVTSPVDGRFLAGMQERVPGFTPDAYGLRKDAAGTWQMTMPVKGPALMPVVAPEMPTGWALQEYGALPLAPAGRTLMAVDDAPLSSVGDCTTWVSTLGFGVPSDGSEIRAKEADGLFVCDVVHKTDWFSHVADDVNAPRPTCQAGDTPTGTTLPGSGEQMEVKAVVSIVGKDVLHAKPGAGAVIRFKLLNLAGNGPTEVVADAGGNGSTFTLAGTQVSAEAYTKEGLRCKPVTFKAVPGMGKVQLVLKLDEGGDAK